MFDIIVLQAICLPAGLVPDMTDGMTDAIVHNFIFGFNSLPAGLVPDMIDAIVHNCISGFNSLPTGLVPDKQLYTGYYMPTH